METKAEQRLEKQNITIPRSIVNILIMAIAVITWVVCGMFYLSIPLQLLFVATLLVAFTRR
jgi:uncharacterized membrane protein YciS (DUF1049 family)